MCILVVPEGIAVHSLRYVVLSVRFSWFDCDEIMRASKNYGTYSDSDFRVLLGRQTTLQIEVIHVIERDLKIGISWEHLICEVQNWFHFTAFTRTR